MDYTKSDQVVQQNFFSLLEPWTTSPAKPRWLSNAWTMKPLVMFLVAILGVSLRLLIDLVSELPVKCELLHGYHSTPSLSPQHSCGYLSALASY